DTEIGGEIFGTVGGKDRDPVPAHQAALDERARNAVGHAVELEIGELARRLLAAEIDDRDLAGVAVAHHEAAEIAEARHDGASLALRRRGRRGEIGAAAAGEELAALVEHLRLGG